MGAKSKTGAAIRGLLGIAIAAALVLAAREVLNGWLHAKAGQASAAGIAEAVPVTLVRSGGHLFTEMATVQGTVLARDFAIVSARQEGLLVAVEVREGDAVVQDRTVLFRTDDRWHRENVQMAEQQLEVARFSLKEKEASQTKDKADFEKTSRDWIRFQDQFAKKTITESQLDAQRAAFEKAEAQLDHAQSLVDLAKANVDVAQNMLNIARKNLDDTVVLAPLDGVVTRRAMEPGQNARPGDIVVRVENVHALEATGFLSGSFFPRVRVGAGVMLEIDGLAPAWHTLTYKAPSVDQGLRTFKIKVDLPGDGHTVIPGQLVNMGVVLREERGLGVPRSALLRRGETWYVFTVRDGKAWPVEVAPGMESGGMIQIVAGDLPSGAEIIHGQMTLAQLDRGTPIAVIAEAAAEDGS